MAISVSILLILAGLTGLHSISTVNLVIVEEGGSISIPCFYKSEYTDHVKYLCKGCRWRGCSYEIKTNQYNSTKYLVSDDKNHGVVTWTINNLREEDTNCYWCIMEIDNGNDDGEQFIVVVIRKGNALLYVDSQEVTGFIGDQLTIYCHYKGAGQIKWCRTTDAGYTSCVKNNEVIDGTKVTIGRNTSDIITVTMSGLMKKSGGWYWVTDGDLQMPVHVTIKERPPTTTTTTTTTTTRQSTTVSSTSKPFNHTYMSQAPTTEQTGTHSSSSNHLLPVIITLCLLLVIVMVVVFIWFMLKRHKSSDTAENNHAVTYSTMTHVRKASGQYEDDVIYCNVTNRKPTSGQVEVIDDGVTYSTLALQR